MQKRNKIRRPSLWLTVPVVLVVTAVWTNTEYPLDYWLHVNNGRWMLEHQQLITVDTFSHTIEGQSVKNQPWLAQLVMYGLHQCGGYRMNQFVAGLGYGLALAGVIWLTGKRCGNWLVAACGGCVAMLLMVNNLGVRPQWFSALLFVAQLALLLRMRSRWPIWATSLGCFVVMCLWTNMHGAYPVGVVLPGILFVATLFDRAHEDKRARLIQLFAAGFASAAGCFVRPFPGDTINYVANCSARSLDRGLQEWLPTSLETAIGPAFFASLLVVLVVLSFSRRRTTVWEMMMLAAFFVLAASSQRMVMWWGLMLPVVMARPADHVWRSATKLLKRVWRGKEKADESPSLLDRCVGGAIAVVILGLIGCSTPWTRTVNPMLPPTKRVAIPNGEPRDLVQAIAASDKTIPTFAPLSWGSYLSWQSRGQLKTFLDTRIDFFPDDVWNAFTQIGQGQESALELLDAFGVELAFCSQRQAGLIARLSASDRWELIRRDEVGFVFRSRVQDWL